MYKPPGLCLNDFDLSFNRALGCYELIHLQGPPLANDIYDAALMETSYGHAFSNDLINWEPQAPVFGISEDAGRFDNGAIWTMQSFYKSDTERFLFYTGVSREEYFYQQIGMAVYDFAARKWRRADSQPLLSPDPNLYQTEGRMAWRDPYVIYDEGSGQYIMFIAAKDKTLSDATNGCIAWAVSSDLENWTIKPPLLSPNRYSEMECPVPYRRGDYWYLLVSVSDTHRVHLWRSRDLLGAYEECGYLTAPRHYAPRVINHNGEDVVLHTQWIERPGRNGLPVWSRGYLCDPRKIREAPDSTLYLEELIT